MTRRMKFRLVLICGLFLSASSVVGQPPPDDRPAAPSSPVIDPEIQQAQNLETPALTRPGRGYWNGTLTSQVGPPPQAAAPVEARPVQSLPPQPPTPAVSLTVLIPRDHPPGQDIPCTIKAANNSGGDAHKVVVRIEPEGADIIPIEPKTAIQPGQHPTWNFKTLKAGESQKIELKLHPKADATSVSVKAFVALEHGQAVKTNLSEPKLQVKTVVPKQHPADDPIPVRVTIHNNGRVAISGAKLTQTISEGFEFHKDIAGGEKTKQPSQRLWAVGTVQPGETKTLQYLVTATKGRSLQVMSVLAAENKVQESDTAESRILESGLKVQISGDGKTTSEQPAQYEATVTNTGTMPLTNVRVTGSIPDECRLTKMTRGGKESQGQVYWTIPKLAPGESQSVRWGLLSSGGGRKQVRAAAIAGRVEDTAKAETVFQGTAILHWNTSFDRDTVAYDQQGVMTIRVSNSGSEPAANVKLSVELPKSLVSVVQVSPAYKKDGEKIIFDTRTVAAGKAETFTITFKGEQFGRAFFNAKLSADALGDKPLGAEKYVEIVRR
ncbi:COG1361 family protein [Limnoglobus roseus]|uniref:DUF11 domain-containing protein n=1 Tax=Limnoglobus roseus TaxID=2598579 RepID=A0A5C1AP38_9BACT|nr:DUF11 domain-containing protein [Limnoglobus roseus]QEL20345.1 hypothetical protein PX52LOC_07438 [Limnoglobus roseus]